MKTKFNTCKDTLIRNWIISLSLALFLEAVLFYSVAYRFFEKKSISGFWEPLFFFGLGLVLCYSLYNFYRFFQGEIVLQLSQRVQMNGGTLVITRPQGTFQLWLFCETSLAQYHGDILVTPFGSQECFKLRLAKRNPFFYPVKSNNAPFIWSFPDTCEAAVSFSLQFHLIPSFVDSVYDRRKALDGHDAITIVIKGKRSTELL